MRRSPAIIWKRLRANEGAQRATAPVVGCAYATTGEALPVATPLGR